MTENNKDIRIGLMVYEPNVAVCQRRLDSTLRFSSQNFYACEDHRYCLIVGVEFFCVNDRYPIRPLDPIDEWTCDFCRAEGADDTRD